MISRKDKIEEHKNFREIYSTRKKAMISKIQKINFGSAPLPPPHPIEKEKQMFLGKKDFHLGRAISMHTKNT